MERENKKRIRDQGMRGSSSSKKKVKKFATDIHPNSKTIAASTHPEASVEDSGSSDGGGQPPAGVFEFPWREEGVVVSATLADVTADLRDVFFSSLVGGCSTVTAAVSFFGDECEIDRGGSTPWDEETNGQDSIWSCALRQPLAVHNGASANTTSA